MKLSDECVKRLLGAVEHTLLGNGPASVTVFDVLTREPAAVMFILPAPIGPLVDTFAKDLYTVLGWHTREQ
jgi:hypothetical protein